MKRTKLIGKFIICVLLVTVCLFMPSERVLAFGNEDTTASVMRLEKTIGDIKLTTAAGKDSQIIEKMRLNSGDDVKSSSKSYAYISLDDSKVVKMDAKSEAVVKKKNKNLEVVLEAGNLFFNVDRALLSDESFEIKTATMTMGIRGTCAQVIKKSEGVSSVYLLDGTVTCTLTDSRNGKSQSATLHPGDCADFYVGDGYPDGGLIIIRRAKIEDIRGFALQYILNHPGVAEKIYEQSGLDFRNINQKQVNDRLTRDEEDMPVSSNDGRFSPTADWYLGDH